MAVRHKIGGHVNAGRRDQYGKPAQFFNNIVTFERGAADDINRQKAIVIVRSHEDDSHKDAPGDFDKLKFEDLYEAGRWWLRRLLPNFSSLIESGDNVYIQVTNEINSPAPDFSKGETQPRILEYNQGVIDEADKLGVKLAILGDAGGSPDLELWEQYWLPFLLRNNGKDIIYNVHVYTQLVAGQGLYHTKETKKLQFAHELSARPVTMARLMLEAGCKIPMLISEFGWRAGWNSLPKKWLADLMRYSEIIVDIPNIIGLSLWCWGGFHNAPHIMGGQPSIDLYEAIRDMETMYWEGFTVDSSEGTIEEPSETVLIPPKEEPIMTEPITTPETNKNNAEFMTFLSETVVDNYCLSLNSEAALEKAMRANGHVATGNERWESFEGATYAIQGAINFETSVEYAYYAKVGDWGNVEFVLLVPTLADRTPDSDIGDEEETIDFLPTTFRGIDILAPNPKAASGHYEIIDVSDWQKNFNYDNLPEHVMGVVAKATEGSSFTAWTLQRNHDEAKRTNRIFGVYHFFHPSVNPEKQAAHFWNKTRDLSQVHHWVTDVEKRLVTDNDPFYDQMLLRFLREFERLSGIRTFIYSADWAINELTTNPNWLAPYPAWMAHYIPSLKGPKMPWPWKADDWVLWQYTSTNRTYIGGNLDVNRTRMDRIEFLDFCEKLRDFKDESPTVAPVVAPVAPTVVNTPPKIDLRPYVLPPQGGTGNYIMETVFGPHKGATEVFNVSMVDGVLTLLKNRLYERYRVGVKFFFSDEDTSPARDSEGNDRYYQVRALVGGLAPRFPLSMHVGEIWHGVSHRVQFYRKSDGQPLTENSGIATNRAELVSVGDWTSQHTGRTFANCAVMRLGQELQIYQQGKLIAWQASWGASEYGRDQGNVKDQPKKVASLVHPPAN